MSGYNFFWQRSHEGEVMVDHRASPGLPEHVARAAGYDPAQCGEGKLFEAATMSCAHCKARVIKNPLRTRERANCPQCSNRYICDWCNAARFSADYVHTPFEKLRDDILEAAATNKGLPWQRESSPLLSPIQPLPPLVLR